MARTTALLKSAVGQDVIARAPAVAVAMLLGMFLFYGVGFANPTAIHNAAHDARHAFAFPCH